jgi:hypoxanthine phosphoribosyltransferase
MMELIVSWSEYHRYIEKLAIEIDGSGWKFDQIVCLSKGGLRVGDILARLFNVPLGILAVKSYGGEEGRIQGKITIAEHLTTTCPDLGPRVLLVDDLVDSGISLEKAKQWLGDHYDGIEAIKTAVIWYKNCSVVEPDYYGEYLQNNPWICQPFEVYENLTPGDLRKKEE